MLLYFQYHFDFHEIGSDQSMEFPLDISKDLHITLFSAVFVVMFFLTSIIQMSNGCKYGLYLIIDNPPTWLQTSSSKTKQIFSLLKLITRRQQCLEVCRTKKWIRFYPFILIFIIKVFLWILYWIITDWTMTVQSNTNL